MSQEICSCFLRSGNKKLSNFYEFATAIKLDRKLCFVVVFLFFIFAQNMLTIFAQSKLLIKETDASA